MVEVCEKFSRIEPDGMRDVDELDDIDPAFALLNAGYVSLPPSKPLCECGLGQASVDTSRLQRSPKLRVLAREQRLRHRVIVAACCEILQN
jgi:hypothetical protein